MKEFFLSLCIVLTGFVLAANAQNFTSETARKAFEKMSQGDHAGAIAVLDKAIDKRKDLLEAYQLRANLRVTTGNLDGAIADFTSALELNPHNAQMYEQRAMFRMFKRDSAGAMSDFDAAIANGLKSEKVYAGRAALKRDVGDIEGSIADYRTTISLNPNFIAAHVGLASTLEKKGDADTAIINLQEFLDRYESSINGKLPSLKNKAPMKTTAEIKREGKEKDGAQGYMFGEQFEISNSPEEMEQLLNLAFAYAYLGRMYKQKDDFDAALKNYEKGLKIKKDDFYLRKLRSEIRFRRGDLKGTIEDLTVVANSPSSTPDRHADKGILLILQGKDAEAEKEFALHLQTFPGAREMLNKQIETAKKLRSQQ